jgi:outer membrane protein assembly factor BamD
VEEAVRTEQPAKSLYIEGLTAMHEEKYRHAAQLFDEVEHQHPYSDLAVHARIMAAYARYQALQYDEVISALNDFIRLHPSSKYTAYAYYLKAICYYERIVDVEHDQEMTGLAMNALSETIRRFPSSSYARDSQLKVDLALDQLAGKEMQIGRWYLNRHQWLAAINRFRRVVSEYQTTSHVPEALHRLTESYLSLGLIDEAQKTAAVLGYNYQDSIWYKDTFSNLQKEGII